MQTDEQNEKRAGRPTKFNEATIDRLCEALSRGCSIKTACCVTGIGVTTLADWRREHPELEEQLTKAKEIAREKALQAIQDAGQKDWRANAEWLKLAFVNDYRRASETRLESNVTVQTALVCDEAMRMRLIEQRQRILAGTPANGAQAP
jgi:hypothetical protein